MLVTLREAEIKLAIIEFLNKRGFKRAAEGKLESQVKLYSNGAQVEVVPVTDHRKEGE